MPAVPLLFAALSAASPAGRATPPTTWVAKEQEVLAPVVPPPQTRNSDLPVGGCPRGSWHLWQAISHDRWVTVVIRRGLELVFVEQPPLARPFHLPSYESGSVRALALVESVRLLIAKGAVELVVPAVFPYPGFSSCLFVVQKPGMGTWRPIIVLSGLTLFMEVPRCLFGTPLSVL